MEQSIAPFIQVRLVWATHHVWKARQTLQFVPPAAALWLVQSGEVEASDSEGGKKWQMSPGEALLWSAAGNRRISTSEGASWLSLGLQVILFDNLDLGRVLDLPTQWAPNPHDWQTLHSCAGELIRQWHGGREVEVDAARIASYTQDMEGQRKHRSSIDLMIAESLARAIFGLCWRHLAGQETAALMERRIPAWLSGTFGRVHREPTISIAELSRDAGFSPAQFRRSFHQHVGVTPREYVLQHRLDIARQLLESEEIPVGAVAARCGFSSLSHFIHIFKQTTGLSPSRYRHAARHARV